MTWHQHLADFRLKNPHLKGKEVMTQASLTYKNVQKADIDSKKHLIDFLKRHIIGEQIVEKYGVPNTKVELEAKKMSSEIDSVKTEDLDSIKTILCDHMDYGFFSGSKGIGYIMSLVEDDDYDLIKKLLEAYHKDGGIKFERLIYE